LPTEKLFELCHKMADEKKYNLKELKVVEGFLDNLQELVAKLIDSVQFNHLMRQKEYEKQESQIIFQMMIM